METFMKMVITVLLAILFYLVFVFVISAQWIHLNIDELSWSCEI